MAPRKGRGAGAKLRDKPVKRVVKQWRLHCHCKRDKSAGWTVICEHCGKWYHGECIGFAEGLRTRIAHLICRRCQRHYNKQSSFLPKCRLESCERPTENAAATAGKESPLAAASPNKHANVSHLDDAAAPAANGDADQAKNSYDQEFCGAEHRELFWSNTVNSLRAAPEKNIQILSWLAHRSGDNHAAFANATPRELPRVRKSGSPAIDELQEALQAALAAREARQQCGFESSLLSRITQLSNSSTPLPSVQLSASDPCEGDIKSCLQHRNWPEMMAKRIELSRLDPEERAKPDPAWLAKRAKYLVAGTTRYSRRTGWRAAYFVPYVWEDDNVEYFLDNNPEPFWDKHF